MKKKKKPSLGGLIAKCAAGFVFIAIGIAPDPEFEAGARAMAIIIGLALVVWGIAKYYSYQKQQKLIMREIEREEQEIREMKAALKNKPRKCPYCGATTKGSVCEYCGSSLLD